ncbi:Uncharacterized protein MSYG_2101 [Malassezia sympodialis ATCC 42132]|uniref:Oxo-4-hydroxy-4-carboxy-5-ureidoimidazoline decarboxylase domain-containing protein n=2 Tax=Malassezia sympodialis (strain ATCC 42132) TaxID=1230383 RepID=A0A1M8A5Y1_MALS4|nr:Uncharacterized protein MSYG_2101 [Malassezia sympodialis ATCC 42132]
MSVRVVVPPQKIPTVDPESLAWILEQLLLCNHSTALRLGRESAQAIADLPEDSRPTTYDSLVDVARFCVEEEPGWDHSDCLSLITQYPRLDDLHRDNARIQSLCNQYDAMYPGLHFITSDEVREPSMASDELESFLSRQNRDTVYQEGSESWQAELDRLLEVLWDVAVDRAVNLTPGPLDDDAASIPEANSKNMSNSDDANLAAGTQPGSADRDKGIDTRPQDTNIPNKDKRDDEPFLTFPAFRALALASPVMEKFFENDLVHSIRLEPVERSASGAAFAWHAAPVVPKGTSPRAVPGSRGPDYKTTSTASNSSPLTSALLQSGSASLDANTPASYSRDITTGARGKVVGFLGGLLGEEGKTRMDALADQVALRLQTHSVKGPLPSFARQVFESPSNTKSGNWRSAFMRGATAAAGAVADGRAIGIGGRLAGALGVNSSKRESDESANRQPPGTDADAAVTLGSGLRGSNLATEGPEAAVATLLAANEALVQERSTFVIDEVQPSDKTNEDLDEDTGSIDGSLSALDDEATTVSC